MCELLRLRNSGVWSHCIALGALLLLSCVARADDGAGAVIEADVYSVGIAAIDITPEHPIRLNGFGGRREEAANVRQRIFAKALAIGTDEEGPAVLVTVDILGIPDRTVEDLAERLAQQTAVRRDRLAVTATHTHSAPMLQGENETLFGVPIPEEHLEHIARYTRVFEAKLEQVVLDALAARQPSRLYFGIGTVGFAINRRTADGPTDHDLPLLAVRSLEGELRGVYVSYACHCVTLSDNQISGDWAGYAQAAIERDYPGCVAICSVGCGADQNPNSGVTGDRADIALGQGEELAAEVRRLLGGFLAPVHGELRAQMQRVDLPLQPLPTRAEWEKRAEGDDPLGHHARVQLARLDRGEELPEVISAPIQSWRFGDSLAVVFLPGETVVDYAVRLKRELDASRIWLNGYSNASPGYVPSERILSEGGYEGGGAMIYYDIPAPYAAGMEQKIVGAVHAQLGDDFSAKVDAARTNGVSPLSPQQSAGRLRTRPELRAELVAAEPLVVDPVAIDFAPDGSLWVAEMHDYPEGIHGDFGPGGRVRLLSDTDGDGRYDRASVFLDGIPFPTGVTTWRQGVLVCAAPDILFAEDTDGDGRADVKQVLFSGFGTGNYQARVNSLGYGLDGWVYGSCGLFGGQITSSQGGDPFPLGDRDFRIQPDTGTIEAATGRSQQGRVCDDWGEWFGCNSGTLVIHYPLSDHDLRRNPFLSAAPAQVGLAPSNQLFPIVPPLTFALSGPPGVTTAACGLGIYRDTLIGLESNGDSFTCEPVSGVVHRLQLNPARGTFTAQRAEEESDREFLASFDGWFRPVQARTGPDGALWVVDMCRYVIEHPRWIPPEDAARVDLRAGETMGRIYRVFPREDPPRPIERLDQMDVPQLVEALDSPNGPQRDLAGQMLIWNDDREAALALIVLLNESERPEARLHALAVLNELHALSDDELIERLQDPHAGVRRQAVRIIESRLPEAPQLVDKLLQLVDDPDPVVRRQLAVTLGAADDSRAAAALVRLTLEDPGDPYLRAAVMSSISSSNVGGMLESALSPRDGAMPAQLVEQLLVAAAEYDQLDALESAVQNITEPRAQELPGWQAGALASLLSTFASRGESPDDVLGAGPAAQIDAALERLRQVSADPDADESLRISAISVLGRSPAEAEADLRVLRDCLSPQESSSVQMAVIRALGRIDLPESAAILLVRWDAATPQLRGAMFDMLVSRPAWLSSVLDGLSSGRIAAVDLDAARAAVLVEHADESVRRRASEVFGRNSSGDRQQVVQQFLSATELEGDTTRGQAVFARACAVCHRLRDVGHEIGPDLAPLSNKSPEYLLQAILDPNSAVDSRYLNYSVVLFDGSTLSGILAEESGGSITLAMQEGRRQSILRRDIDVLRSTGKSMMPDGLEKDQTEQSLADLLAYLRMPTGAAPASPKSLTENEPQLVEADDSGRLLLLATNASIYGESIIFEAPFRNIGYWHGETDHVAWTLRTPAETQYDIWMIYACDPGSAGSRFLLEGGREPLGGEVPATSGWSDYRKLLIGSITLAEGEQQLTMRPAGPLQGPALCDLHGLELVPVNVEPELPLPSAEQATRPAAGTDIRRIAVQILNEALPQPQREALISEHVDAAPELIAVLAEDLPAGAAEYRRIPWIWRVAIAAGNRNDAATLRSILRVSLPGPEQPLRDWQSVVIGGGVINGLSQQNVWPQRRIDELLANEPETQEKWTGLLALASDMADDERTPHGTRYDALRILGCGEWEPHGQQLLKYLPARINQELQMGAVSGLADLDAPEATSALRQSLAHLTGHNRELAIAALLRTGDRAKALLDTLEDGALQAGELQPDQVSALRTHADESVRQRSRRLMPD